MSQVSPRADFGLGLSKSSSHRLASRRSRLLWLTLVYITVILLCGLLDLTETSTLTGGRGFSFLERYAQYVRQGAYEQLNGTSLIEEARRDIILLILSDASFDKGNLAGPPVPRSYHAKVVRELTRAGAKVIVFDLIFDLPGHEPTGDEALANAARASGRVVWACLLDDEDKPVLPINILRRASPYYGHVHVPQDSDVVALDGIEPVIQSGSQPIPALSLESVLLAQGMQHQRLVKAGISWRVGDMAIPLDSHGRMKISYLGKSFREVSSNAAVFRSIPYETVYHATAKNRSFLRDLFRDKIVLIGDVTTVGNDHRLTQVGDMSGIEVQANAMATLLQRNFVHEMPEWVNLLVMSVLAALICPLMIALPLRRGVLTAVVLTAGYFVANVGLFTNHRILLHLVAPEVALGLCALTILTERSFTEEREKTRMQTLLQRYVSPQIAQYIIAHPDQYVLGGERVTATVLFSDIRGFTVLSERLGPEQVVARLNEYLQAMSEVIFKHDGAVDKFIGDAIMALFGVPVPHADHAYRAVATAIDMQSALLALQEKWREQGLPLIDIGIGINTGEMVVGNIGYKDRLDFTVIGDAVNIAAGVENLNKTLHSRILITEATYEFVKDKVKAHGPLPAHIKNREEEIMIYEIFGWRDSIDSTASEPLTAALKK